MQLLCQRVSYNESFSSCKTVDYNSAMSKGLCGLVWLLVMICKCGPRIHWREGTCFVNFPGIRGEGLSHVTPLSQAWGPGLASSGPNSSHGPASSTPSGASVEAGPAGAGACRPAVPVLSGGSYTRRGWETGARSQSDSREPSDPTPVCFWFPKYERNTCSTRGGHYS